MKNFHSLSEIQSELASGKLTVAGLVQYHLDKISKKNKELNAFLTVYGEQALDQAKIVDQKLQARNAGSLAGLIVGIKDVFCLKDTPLTCASHILEGFHSKFTATCIQRLLDEDAIIIGRQNCDEFAMGSTNENSSFGPTKNPVDHTRVPGGSSGGSACSVAADFCQVSIGSDTGGSVRQPAAFCGVYGLKPTYGRISRYGLAAYASSFDTVGIISKSVEDASRVLEVMSGFDPCDSTSSSKPINNIDAEKSNKIKVGVLSIEEGVQAEIVQCIKDLESELDSKGYTIEPIEFNHSDYLLPVYYVLTTAEASSNLSRYDGVRFGAREEADDINDMFKQTRTSGFGTEVKRRIMTGTFVLSAKYHDAYYTQAQKVRRMIQEETEKLLSEYDFIISPTTPSTAPKIGELIDDPIRMYMEDFFTVRANVVGIPAISIPYGKDTNGLPIGLQVMTRHFNESELMDFSNQISSLTR